MIIFMSKQIVDKKIQRRVLKVMDNTKDFHLKD